MSLILITTIINMSQTPHLTHDPVPSGPCLCSTCIDDIPAFTSCLTSLSQARAVASHILAKHQAQLVQLKDLQDELEGREPVMERLKNEIEVLRQRVEEYDEEGGRGYGHNRTSSSSSFATSSSTSSTQSSHSLSSAESDSDSSDDTHDALLTQLVHTRQLLKSRQHRPHPAALRLRAAANEFANQARLREEEAEREADAWMVEAEMWRARTDELGWCEQFLVDVQIWREMSEWEVDGYEEGMGEDAAVDEDMLEGKVEWD